MEARIGHLNALLENAVIIEHLGEVDTVASGTIVTLTYEGDDDEERYLIGMIEEQRDGLDVISPTSPLGSALLGKKVGETASFSAPGGDLTVEIKAIDI
jgi:transcription elongation factor GreA